jgi:hypothetical protein
MQVGFTTHARERFEQRMNIQINPGFKVELDDNFELVYATRHTESNNRIQTWIWPDAKKPVVLTVDVDNMCIITVMTSGPVVEKAYNTPKKHRVYG